MVARAAAFSFETHHVGGALSDRPGETVTDCARSGPRRCRWKEHVSIRQSMQRRPGMTSWSGRLLGGSRESCDPQNVDFFLAIKIEESGSQ
jgi:hypothetical protein